MTNLAMLIYICYLLVILSKILYNITQIATFLVPKLRCCNVVVHPPPSPPGISSSTQTSGRYIGSCGTIQLSLISGIVCTGKVPAICTQPTHIACHLPLLNYLQLRYLTLQRCICCQQDNGAATRTREVRTRMRKAVSCVCVEISKLSMALSCCNAVHRAVVYNGMEDTDFRIGLFWKTSFMQSTFCCGTWSSIYFDTISGVNPSS